MLWYKEICYKSKYYIIVNLVRMIEIINNLIIGKFIMLNGKSFKNLIELYEMMIYLKLIIIEYWVLVSFFR